MKPLTTILKHLKIIEFKGPKDLLVSAIDFDTRKIKRSEQGAITVYVAQKGTQVDGHNFIAQAIEKGAGAVVCERLPEHLQEDVSYIVVPDATEALGYMAAAFYDYPSEELQLVGITGTNGKTTTVTMLYHLFKQMNYKTGLLSTIENRIDEEVLSATHTTPDAVSLNRLLREMADAGCQYCFMEVSSHAIVQRRIAGLSFAGAIFSNITHDHLDFHKTFAGYIKAKKAFFDSLPKEAFALTNKDDKNGLVMTQNTKAHVATYSLTGAADIKGKILDNSFEGLQMEIDGQEVYFRLTGRFNAYNLLAIYGTATLLGLSKQNVLIAMSNLQGAPGRFQVVPMQRNRKAIVDYAHTPDALNNVLSTINDIVQNNAEVITVVGCGGDRDALKRPIMATTACNFSNKVILTSDNPRSEDPHKILEDMLEGVPVEYKHHVLVIENRREAIKTACMLLPENGILLIAGKGHETYQEIKGVKEKFDDVEEVMNYEKI